MVNARAAAFAPPHPDQRAEQQREAEEADGERRLRATPISALAPVRLTPM